jgi:uncharacterized protein with PIN domain
MNICENCEKEHNGGYGSGRFCDYVCARGFSTKFKRNEINLKVSKTLSKTHDGLTKQQRIQLEIADKHASYVRETEITSLFDLSKRTISKILKRMSLPCSLCNWFVEKVVCDIHHINEKKNGGTDEHTNLTYVCPNCHRLIHNGNIEKEKIVNLYDYIGDSWKDYYYVKNGRLNNK